MIGTPRDAAVGLLTSSQVSEPAAIQAEALFAPWHEGMRLDGPPDAMPGGDTDLDELR